MKKTIAKLTGVVSALALMISVGVSVGTTKNASKASAGGEATVCSGVVSGEKYYITATYNKVEYVLKTGAFSAGGSGSYTAAYQGGAGLSESDAWIFTAVTGGYTISTTDGNYLSVTATNNGVVSSTTSAVWTMAESDTDYVKLSSADSASVTRYLALYNGSNWRCYSSGSGVQNIKLYHYVADTKTLSSIAVTTLPTKTSYNEGDALDLTGAVVTASYDDSSTADVTSSATFSPADGTSLSASDTTVTVSYGGKSTSFPITVAAKAVSTEDLYITAASLGLTTSYATTVKTQGDFSFGVTNVMKNNSNCIQLKATTGAVYNKTGMGAAISKLYIAFDSDNSYAPSNWAVKFSADTPNDGDAVTGTCVDSVNYIYEYDVSSSAYKYFTIAKSGSYATYIDMIVVEMVHANDDIAAVRTAAANMDAVLTTVCAAKNGPTSAQWETITGYYNGLTASQKAIFDATTLNTATCNSADANNAPVQLTTIQKVVSRVEYIVSTYGMTNFTSRTISSRAILRTSEIASANYTVALVAAVISVSALAAFVVLKKKKASK